MGTKRCLLDTYLEDTSPPFLSNCTRTMLLSESSHVQGLFVSDTYSFYKCSCSIP